MSIIISRGQCGHEVLWPLAGFVLGCSELKSVAALVNSQLVISCQFGFLISLCSIRISCLSLFE